MSGKFFCLGQHPLLDRFADSFVTDPKLATDILVVSGDGGMLSAVQSYHLLKLPFCGINVGHVGFLMNECTESVVEEIMRNDTVSVSVRMLEAVVTRSGGEAIKIYAFNDLFFERASSQAANIKVSVDDKVYFDSLICDGVLVCNQVGSTAYNASAGGVIVPIETEAMVLTGICPAIFHHWRSSLLASTSKVVLEPLNTEKRPVRFSYDGKIIEDAIKASISYSEETVELKFAESQRFREKSLRLQFLKN